MKNTLKSALTLNWLAVDNLGAQKCTTIYMSLGKNKWEVEESKWERVTNANGFLMQDMAQDSERHNGIFSKCNGHIGCVGRSNASLFQNQKSWLTLCVRNGHFMHEIKRWKAPQQRQLVDFRSIREQSLSHWLETQNSESGHMNNRGRAARKAWGGACCAEFPRKWTNF